jgi:hypothetical protein
MYVPDITKTINNVQRNTVPVEDINVVCSAVQYYWKHLEEVGATKRGVNVEYVNNTDKILEKYLDKMTRDDLFEIAVNKGIAIVEDDTRAKIISKIKGE